MWIPVWCYKYMDAIFELQKLLAIGIMVTSSELPWLTELASWLHVKISTDSAHNVLWMFNMTVFHKTYNKTSTVTGQEVHMIHIPLPHLG